VPIERDGLVRREAEPVNPPRVDCSLTTPLGRETAERPLALIEPVEGRMPEVPAAQRLYDESAAAARGGR
jgi:DNA-binding HxlR family transcriptional regulator